MKNFLTKISNFRYFLIFASLRQQNLEIQGENNVIVKAEVNRKTLKKQVAKMDEYEEWVGALSGKIKSVSTDGVIELEGAGLQVFEKKKKEEAKPDNQSTAA
ncbi:hypothetical protein [Myxosarcina sp. GI1(2024)]